MKKDTYPAGKHKTALFVPDVRILNTGLPVTKLFQEYGSATSVPAMRGAILSSDKTSLRSTN
jgi:hypothetical protein